MHCRFLFMNLCSALLFSQPTIHQFNISPTQVDIGNPVTLSWQVSDAESVTIDQGIGTVNSEGSIEIIPLRDTVYTLTAESFLGKVQNHVQVDVNFNAAPYISSFFADPDFIAPSDVTEIFWETHNASSVRVVPDIGRLPLSGSQIVSPPTSTNYELVAENVHGTTSAFFQVTVSTGSLPKLDHLFIDPNPVHAGSQFSIEWSILNADLVSFYRGNQLRFQNRLPSGKTTEKAELGSEYLIVAENQYGSEQWEIPVQILPRVLELIEFKATPPAIFPGQQVSVDWEIQNVDKVKLSQAGEVPSKGNTQITLAVTTTLVLTAEVDGHAEQFRLTIPVLKSEPHHALYFPYFPDGLGGKRLINLVNLSSEPLSLLFNTYSGDLLQDEKNLVFEPNASKVIEINDKLNQAWAQVLVPVDLPIHVVEGHAIVVPATGDILAYEACRNQASPMLVPHIAKWPQFSTRANVINLSYEDQFFELVQSEKTEIGAVGALQTFSQELGILNFQSGWGYIQPEQGYSAMVGVQTFGSQTDPKLSALSLGNSTPKQDVLYFPHIADRSRFWTGMVIINPNPQEARLDFEVFDSAGILQPGLPPIVLQPFKKQLFLVDQIRNDFGSRADWVRVQSDHLIAGYMIFGNYSGNQVQCGLPTGFEPAKSLVFPYAYADGFLGMALLNPSNSSNLVQLERRSPTGEILGEQAVNLAPTQRKVFLAQDLFPNMQVGDAIWTKAAHPISGFLLIGQGDRQLGGLMAIQNGYNQDSE